MSRVKLKGSIREATTCIYLLNKSKLLIHKSRWLFRGLLHAQGCDGDVDPENIIHAKILIQCPNDMASLQ